MVGRTLGRYCIVEELGAGGMGAVYRAHDERLNRDVAIKVLAATAFDSDEARSRFRREALALSRLNHPNIASVHDFDTQDGLDLLVMELVPGVTLNKKLSAGPLPEKEILLLGKQLMQGLAAAHEAGIVHRDLKPGNIRITPDGRLKILDFGLAKELGPTPDTEVTAVATATGQIVGTLPYMAPEQLRGEAIDARTDIHAAGAVLYEMSTGRRPFPEQSTPLLTDQILNQAPVPPRSLNARLSAPLEQVILKALEKDPDHRYQSANEAGVDLERIALARVQTTGGEVRTPTPGPAPAPGPVTAHGPRHRKLFFGISAGTVAIAAGVVMFWLMSNKPALSFAPRDWILLASVENTTGDPVFDKSLDAAFRVSLEQSMYANVFSQSRVTGVLKRMGKEGLETIDVPVGREICQRESIRGLVSPSISQVGRHYAVTTRLIDPVTGDTVRSYAEQAGSKDDVLVAVDKVAGKLRRDLGEALQAVQQTSMPLWQATTSSLDALKAHAEAMYAQGKGKYQDAVALFQQAIKLDPDFALAHAGLGGIYMSHIYNATARGREHLERAMKLRDRVTERERLIVELNYHSSLDHTDEAVRLFREFLSKWPDAVRQRYNFGNVLRDHDRLDEAIEQYRHAIRIQPDHASSYVNLATCYKSQGKFKDAIDSWQKAFALEPTWVTNGNLNHEYGVTLVAAGDVAKAREVFDLAIKNRELQAMGLRSAALLDMYEGKYRVATSKLEEAIVVNKAARATLNEARNHLFLAIALAGRGDRAGALRELDASFKLRDPKSPQAWLWARVGAMYAGLGALPKANAVLEVVQAETAADSAKQRGVLHWLEGEVELARGKAADALEKLQVADKEGHSAMTQEALARAHRAAGDRARAAEAYEALDKSLGEDCIGWEVQQACLVGKYELAALYQADRQPEKARRQLDELLALWQGADEDLPMLESAKAFRAKLGEAQ